MDIWEGKGEQDISIQHNKSHISNSSIYICLLNHLMTQHLFDTDIEFNEQALLC